AAHRAALSSLSPKRRCRRMQNAAIEGKTVLAIFLKQQRPIEINEARERREIERGRHAKAGAEHTADHHAEPVAARRLGEQQGLSKPASLVELDIDKVIERRDLVECCGIMGALIGADGDRPINIAKNGII